MKYAHLLMKKNKSVTTVKVFDKDINPEKLKSQINNISELNKLEEILHNIETKVTGELHKYFKTFYNG